MSKQLSFSATVSVLTMALFAMAAGQQVISVERAQAQAPLGISAFAR
ncbi:hypothetical protein [Parerythrobacter aestuarii]|nr:hypothetical protein [Parerythrobacter aestuarii]